MPQHQACLSSRPSKTRASRPSRFHTCNRGCSSTGHETVVALRKRGAQTQRQAHIQSEHCGLTATGTIAASVRGGYARSEAQNPRTWARLRRSKRRHWKSWHGTVPACRASAATCSTTRGGRAKIDLTAAAPTSSCGIRWDYPGRDATLPF